MNRTRILFLCTGNSCRSQMAEGLCRQLQGDRYEAASCGIEKHGMNRLAVRAMRELGIDISGQSSKTCDELEDQAFDIVVTVCGHADELCPVFPGGIRVVHRGFEDPPKLAIGAANDDEAMPFYRQVRDEIREFIEGFPDTLGA
jgi:arsenate reductase